MKKLSNKITNLYSSIGMNFNIPYRNETDIANKAESDNFLGRFKEIISDPLNILINRTKKSGTIDAENFVHLHNGNKVQAKGKMAYYGEFSAILAINRGVHEPLEEFVFQEVIKKLKTEKPVMIELGSYWAHYSMWLQSVYKESKNYMIDADQKCLDVGAYNFNINRFEGEFYCNKVGKRGLNINSFVKDKGINHIDILHSDIQGFELEMIQDANEMLLAKAVDRIFISTHSDELHKQVLQILNDAHYIIEISSNFSEHTTSGDGFIFASADTVEPVFNPVIEPLGRLDIGEMTPGSIIKYISSIEKQLNH